MESRKYATTDKIRFHFSPCRIVTQTPADCIVMVLDEQVGISLTGQLLRARRLTNNFPET